MLGRAIDGQGDVPVPLDGVLGAGGRGEEKEEETGEDRERSVHLVGPFFAEARGGRGSGTLGRIPREGEKGALGMSEYVVGRLAAPVDAADVRALAGLLVDAVESGAAVSFLQPLSMERAETWWRGVLGEIDRERGPTVLVARDRRGEIVGTVQLHRAWAPNQPHRGDIAKLIVHRKSQRSGLGERLMLAAEEAARGAGLSLLTLDARAGGAAERLYRRLGWTAVGVIPDYAVDADGKGMHGTVVFWKRVVGAATE